jgi:hypothetical protein
LNEIKVEEKREAFDTTFKFTISEPTRKPSEGVQLTYWVYKVTTVTNLEQYPNKELSVFRRFSDFEWLSLALEALEVGCIVPPLPEKDLMGNLDKLINIDSKQMLEYRQRALSKFLTRVGEHPILSTSKHLQMFLELPDKDFTTIKGVKINPKVVAPTFGNLFRSAKSKEDDFVVEARKVVGNLDSVFKNLKAKLGSMIESRKVMGSAVTEFGKAFGQFGNLEKSLDDGLLPKALFEISNKSQEISLAMVSQSERENIKIIETLSYYQGMIASIQKQIYNLELLRYARDDATVAKQGLEKYRKPETEQQIVKAKEVETTAENTLKQCLDYFKNDMSRFGDERRVDFRVMIMEFVTLQSDYALSVEKSWDSLVPTLQNINRDLYE